MLVTSHSCHSGTEKRMGLWLETVYTFCLFLATCVFGKGIYVKAGTQFPALL